MNSNQLPENMGKKIVEALKRQALYEEDYSNNNIQETINTPVAQDMNFISEQNQEPQINEIKEIEEPQITSQFTQQLQTHSTINESPMQFSMPNTTQTISFSSYTPDLPTNVAVLKKLISQLPAGVSKQVGAQIIRQTIEALGISMNSVLQEAQQVQETLNNAVTECSIKMQEYKNQIMQLEANTRDYQRQMAQINDLISLFILTDNKK